VGGCVVKFHELMQKSFQDGLFSGTTTNLLKNLGLSPQLEAIWGLPKGSSNRDTARCGDLLLDILELAEDSVNSPGIGLPTARHIHAIKIQVCRAN